MNLIFFIICLFHVIIWLFIVFAFLNKKTSYYNLLYVIPLIYICHMLPFHILTRFKESIYKTKDEFKKNNNEAFNILIFPSIHKYFRDNVFKNSFANPFSPQGLLILGAITSAWSLKKNLSIDL